MKLGERSGESSQKKGLAGQKRRFLGAGIEDSHRILPWIIYLVKYDLSTLNLRYSLEKCHKITPLLRMNLQIEEKKGEE